MSSDPILGGLHFVPMDLYLEDRRRSDARLDRIEGKLDHLIVATAQDDGREVAEDAAATAVSEARRSRGELFRDAGLCILAAVLAVAGTLVTTAITGA